MSDEKLSAKLISRPPKKVLVVLLGALGDVVRGLPMAVRIKQAWPETELTWAVEPLSRGILEQHPAIDKIIEFKRKEGFAAYLRFLKEIRESSYDLALDMQRHVKSGFTTWASRAPIRLGFHPQNSREGNWLFQTHHIPSADHFSSKILQFQAFGDVLGLPPLEPLDFGLSISREEAAKLEEKLFGLSREQNVTLGPPNQRVALLLGSSWESRVWPMEHYRSLIEALHRKSAYSFVLIGGPGDSVLARELLSLPGEGDVLDLTGKTTLRELAGVFSQVAFAVGSDSGPMHIASALGLPVISLWGSTSPLRSVPFGNAERVLQSAIGCSPCYFKRCPGLNTLCMREIRPEAVLQMCRTLV